MFGQNHECNFFIHLVRFHETLKAVSNSRIPKKDLAKPHSQILTKYLQDRLILLFPEVQLLA
jgi:hypothetical protein